MLPHVPDAQKRVPPHGYRKDEHTVESVGRVTPSSRALPSAENARDFPLPNVGHVYRSEIRVRAD